MPVHVSGDFYDAGYVAKWARIARASPHTAFFAYTRSWRRGEVLAALAELARLPNLRLWFSEDRDTGRPPTMPGVRRAYLLADGEAESSVPEDADLVFRVPLPRRPGATPGLCPAGEAVQWRPGLPQGAGHPPAGGHDLLACRICFTGAPSRAIHVSGRSCAKVR